MVTAGSITVAVRVRPPSAWEAQRLREPRYDALIRTDGALSAPGKLATSGGCLREIVQILDDRILTFDPDEKDRSRAFVERGFLPPGTKRYKDKRFIFDRVFNHEAQQRDVYESTSEPLLKGLLDGYNATVFAYGATGCGKTHTISGTEADPGIVYLTMADLFQRIEDRKDEYEVEVMVTFLEIYNEEIRDLLAEPGSLPPRGGLSIREDKAVKVVGLVELRPKSAEEVKEIVLQGNARRTQSPTHANETSSRSHAVLQVHVTQSPRTANITETRTMATLSIIDLAGSERAAATNNMGQRMVEGANINKSLLALGNCINALCESGGAIRHVPYRNSKLTRLLKFSLGGNCKTVMIVCVAPTSHHFDDTHNTLVYAERATKIKTKVITRNVVNVDRHVGRYVEAINRLNIEVAELKAKLSGKVSNEADILRRKRAEANAEVERAKQDMQVKLEKTQASIADGASCAGKLFVAEVKLRALRARWAQIDAQEASSSSPLSPDLQAERALLRAVAAPEEQAVRADSVLRVRLQRSDNSTNLYEAALRAVSERRSDKLDEVSVESIKLDARWRKAEIERIKAEAERDAMKAALDAQAEMIANLFGMVGRCTVMIGEAGQALKSSVEEGRDGMEGTVKAVANSLRLIADKNNETFQDLVGHTVAEYAAESRGPLALNGFVGYSTNFTTRTSSAPTTLPPPPKSRVSVSRRSSSYGSSVVANTSASVPSRRSCRSPRKSLRSSLASQPYTRRSSLDKHREKEKKSVQWRDEAGKGSLDDGGPKLAMSNDVEPASASAVLRSTISTNSDRSESEWEDEKTEDSLSLSFSSQSRRDSGLSRIQTGKRRASRLMEPLFAKSKGAVLSSLAEDDEDSEPTRRLPPLSDLSVNQLPTPDDSSSGGSSRSSSMAAPKAKTNHILHGSPARRGPSTPRAGAASKGGRRRSIIGPLRLEKARRRSSLIPRLSPHPKDTRKSTEAGARRVPAASQAEVSMRSSPAKRAKRSSNLDGIKSAGPIRLKLGAFATSGSISVISAGSDPNASADISLRSSTKPTWR